VFLHVATWLITPTAKQLPQLALDAPQRWMLKSF
jgi:hypothetical protein